MRKDRLTWEEVEKLAGNEPITVHYDGIEKSGYCNEEHMTKQFNGCQFKQCSRHDFDVIFWPEGKTQCRDWRERKNED